MVTRAPGISPAEAALRWYSQRELADLWRVHPVTVRTWLMHLRRAGFGPRSDQAYIQKVNAARRFLMIRGDYAVFMFSQRKLGMK